MTTEYEEAKRYVKVCEDNVTAAMYCDAKVLMAACRELHRAQLQLKALEND